MDISLIVLGSGQDGGSPQLGRASGRGPDRTASSIAIVVERSRILLFDASPDIRLQLGGLVARVGPRPPGRPVDAVFVTHCHMGHYAGLVHFGPEAAAADAIPLGAPMSVLEFLDGNEPWSSLLRARHLDARAVEEGPTAHGPVTVASVPVPHRAEFTTTVGYSIAVGGEPWALYVPDIDGWEGWPESRAVVGAHRVVVLDATFTSPDEVPGRNLAEIPHPLVPDTLDRFGDLTTGRTIVLGHMNHTNPLADPSSTIASTARERGFTVAYDGLVIDHA